MAKTPKDLPNDVPSGRAIAIRQPYIEAILLGKKKYEYRSRPTQIRGRVYLYASLGEGSYEDFRSLEKLKDTLPRGMIVGSVEIVDCVEFGRDDYGYKLKNPKRYRKHFKPREQAQPCWFFPYGKPSDLRG